MADSRDKFAMDVAGGHSGSIPLTAPGAVSAAREPSTRTRIRRGTSLAARGEPMVWLTGGAVATCVLMILTLLLFVAYQGFATFWPLPFLRVEMRDQAVVFGEPTRQDVYQAVDADGERRESTRTLYRIGNFDISGERFKWVNQSNVAEVTRPEWGLTIERVSWGNAYGMLESITVDGQTVADPARAWDLFQDVHPEMRALIEQKRELELDEGGAISEAQEEIRLTLRGLRNELGADSELYRQAAAEVENRQAALQQRMTQLRQAIAAIDEQIARARITIRTSDGKIIPADRSRPDEPLLVAQIVRAYPPNQLSTLDKAGVYLSRWWEYLTDDPREANTEGGVFPAIIGTVLLTLIMIVFVLPVGVIAALYLREYARQGLLVSIIRISVNNLAGVPSIVYGVFGLGFFCYLIGGNIDQIFFSERLPDPTVGKSAMIWASLTLALLTLPVVIVATEEALAAVPRSMREGSYACGASKWQTIRRIVLPRAMPGIMTGMILAIARGAGEVAPLMLVGAVKLAPGLPISADGPLFGLNRSFMHLGFHIYDLGFQSPDSEAARSMVYTTTLLLIAIVVVLNVAAILIRSRLRRAYAGGHF